ncbi:MULTISPECIES: alpha/beta fold hydrolase [unclassified Methanoregula]|uniref:alpha/beta fold hydrolase n=1 Tax=unclassified Methanoregula TaxID=2649730 RepID=UPI0009D092C5|nr:MULTISPECIES: alpha/beta fold hydrolase [unclassified Methanoregula]OPX64876.1 MAG: Alpha/beta hydrolase family protein [Methanoregula sp. PtaB.Bin085]OPY32928.1 MAG: Alpha/beta hydrolase family protein [Methanoregula sp. PtaU1.Bin006]
MQFVFPTGYLAFSPVTIINYQLNRWYSLGYARLEDMQEAGRQVRTFDDWKSVMTGLAEEAEAEDRWINAALYYRAAEFFVLPSDPDKERLYDRFSGLFYTRAFAGEPFERHRVPYAGTFLPTLRVPAMQGAAKGSIVIHGGFDSFIEEWYSCATFFASHGYDVILFEGPGQGAALKRSGLPLTHEWEKPVKAVLDHFRLENVTLLGISMGGWLCFRAAAFEPRIRRVIASSIAFDYMLIPPRPVRWLAGILLRFPRLMDRLARLKMNANYQERWGISNLMYITKNPSPTGASEVLLQFNGANQHPELVKQDVLILTGAEDHFIPLKIHELQVNALKNARSVTARIFTRETQAQNHCQIGNIGLALGVMLEWIEEKTAHGITGP